jgi:hypothetical protein
MVGGMMGGRAYKPRLFAPLCAIFSNSRSLSSWATLNASEPNLIKVSIFILITLLSIWTLSMYVDGLLFCRTNSGRYKWIFRSGLQSYTFREVPDRVHYNLHRRLGPVHFQTISFIPLHSLINRMSNFSGYHT